MKRTVIWIISALSSAISYTIVNIIDSHLVSKKMPSLSSVLLPLGIFQLLISLVVLTIFHFPDIMSLTHVLVAFGSGLISGCTIIILLYNLQKGEVSRVVPVVTSAPIFVALLSIPLLGEILGFWQWLAVLLTVAGAVLISLQLNYGMQKARLQKSFFILLGAALMSAMSSIGYKYALESISFWNMVSINGICVFVVVLLFTLRKSTLLELKNLKGRNQKLGLIFGNQLIAAAAGTFVFIAISNGPVALVSTITNIRPLFIFVFSLIISRFYPNFINEHLNRRTIIVKLIGIVMITGGVAIISLSS